MFINLNSNQAYRPRFLGELGSLPQSEIALSEFKYRRGAEIFGEAEPAE
jgi:CRP/FNR family transcriptional regulator, nitrogen fixation regulation protein